MTNAYSTIPAEQLAQAVQCLKDGGLVAFPTETVYGLGADATNVEAIESLYRVKGRPATRPLTVHLADIEELDSWAQNIPAYARRLIEHFCPGPLTLILPRRPEVLDLVTAGNPSVGVRWPSHPMARQLIRAFGSGLVAPSANRSGYISPTSAQDVYQELGSDVATIIDGGPCSIGIESTILDCTANVPRILRPGILSQDILQEVAKCPIEYSQEPTRATSGQHYRPHTPTWLCSSTDIPKIIAKHLNHSEKKIALISHSHMADSGQICHSLHRVYLPQDPLKYAQKIYSHLRYLDACCLEAIFIEEVPNAPEWQVLRQRLEQVSSNFME